MHLFRIGSLAATVGLLATMALGQDQKPAMATGASQSGPRVFQNEWFRLRLPEGWRESQNEYFKGAMAAFDAEQAGLTVGVAVVSKAFPLSAEEYLARSRRAWEKDYNLVAEEDFRSDGFPAKKLIYEDLTTAESTTVWQIVLLTRDEHWRLTVLGTDPSLQEPNGLLYQGLQQLLSSLEFLEPARSRLRQLSVSPQEAAELMRRNLIQARLQNGLNAKSAKVGDTVELEVTSDVPATGGGVAIPKKARLLGTVTEVAAHSKEQPESRLSIHVQRAEWENGSASLDAHIAWLVRGKESPSIAPSAGSLEIQPTVAVRTGAGNIRVAVNPSGSASTLATRPGMPSGSSPSYSSMNDILVRNSPDPRVVRVLVSKTSSVSLPRGTRFVFEHLGRLP